MTAPFRTVISPWGWVQVILNSNGNKIAAIEFVDAPISMSDSPSSSPLLDKACGLLNSYFEGRTVDFSELYTDLEFNGTEFQHKVWQALLTIPYGQTRSYKQIAEQIAQPTASRAVGMANGRNPIAIVVPCHRVIGASGQLTGYAGGLSRKAGLLALEA